MDKMAKNRYIQIIEHLFQSSFEDTLNEIEFSRSDIEQAAKQLDIDLPKNLGDVLYSFRYRINLPESITKTAPDGFEWIIRPAGRSQYKFVLSNFTQIQPNPQLIETKIPDATPGIILTYTSDDEQGLLAKVRYNRLIDIFTGLTCYSLQNHFRTTVPNIGQVETDELYVGLDKRGVHYIIPVQAKGGTDKIGVVQIEQDFAVCAEKYPRLICRPIAVQFMRDDLIALVEFEIGDNGVGIAGEKHYRLVLPNELSNDELERYKMRDD